MTDETNPTLGSLALDLAAQDAALADLREQSDRLARGLEDHQEDKRTHGFADRTRSEIARMRQAADRLHDSYVNEQKKLYREDGQKKYSEAEHREVMDDLTRQRDEAFAGLKERAESLSSEIAGKLEAASSPERYLSDEEMERATIRANFVREDIESRPLGEVPGLLREAELSGERVRMWLASRYATMRHDRELEELRDSGGAGIGAEEISRHLREVREGAQRLFEQLQPPGAKGRKETLEKLRGEAAGLTGHVRGKSIAEEERIARSSSPFR